MTNLSQEVHIQKHNYKRCQFCNLYGADVSAAQTLLQYECPTEKVHHQETITYQDKSFTASRESCQPMSPCLCSSDKKLVQSHCTYFLTYDSPWLRYHGNETDCCLADLCWFTEYQWTKKPVQLVKSVSVELRFCFWASSTCKFIFMMIWYSFI
jgi:hypothetical protein